VVGAGPAGLMAAIQAAQTGTPTAVLEANPIAGKKLLLTGGGRCNLTHQGCPDEILQALGPRGRFLAHCIHRFPPACVIQMFEGLGLPVWVTPDGSAFPGGTARATAVRDVLLGEARRLGVQVLYGRAVDRVLQDPAGGFLLRTSGQTVRTRRLVLATGGLSYPHTGSTGQGLRMAQALGHTLVRPRPALVPLVTAETWPPRLAGLSIGPVRVRAKCAARRVSETGDLVFTQDGIGGPAVLNLSRHLTDSLSDEQDSVEISIDLLPDVPEDAVERQILQWAQTHPKKTVTGQVAAWVPRRLAEVLAHLAGCPADLRVSHLGRDHRRGLVQAIKALGLHIVATRPMAEATITRGGVATDQIDPKTMQSRLCAGLFFAGEMIDVDGPCGGYNLQICWSTGALAGAAAR